MSKQFAEALAKQLEQRNLKPIDLEKLSNGKLKRSNISRILNQIPHHITGALPKVSKPTVLLIAQTIGWNVNEALNLAGFASAINIPDDLIIEGFEGLDQSDIDMMVKQIRFLKSEKKKGLEK